MNKHVELCYPGFTKKALTFSMDDGRVQHDARLLDILRPLGIKGTFNLPKVDLLTPEEYRELYRGYEIANHCKHHPYAFDDDVSYKISDEAFDPERADGEYIYRYPERENFYYFKRSVGWRLMTDPKTYITCIKACQAELEAVFGEGSVNGYAWPFNEQNSREIKQYLASSGYYGVRKSGLILDSTDFDLPADVMSWCCNANHTNLCSVMALYEAYPDDGRLKMFSFGVHASDFEKFDKWDELREFAARYGGRPEDYWYATVGEIFEYRRAAESLRIEESTLTNVSRSPLYVKVDGECVVIPAGASLEF